MGNLEEPGQVSAHWDCSASTRITIFPLLSVDASRTDVGGSGSELAEYSRQRIAEYGGALRISRQVLAHKSARAGVYFQADYTQGSSAVTLNTDPELRFRDEQRLRRTDFSIGPELSFAIAAVPGLRISALGGVRYRSVEIDARRRTEGGATLNKARLKSDSWTLVGQAFSISYSF